jgi:predicted Zn-dependent peptidase
MYYKEKVGSILTSKLDNGVTVVTESDTFPHSVDLGILIDVGTRDEVKCIN